MQLNIPDQCKTDRECLEFLYRFHRHLIHYHNNKSIQIIKNKNDSEQIEMFREWARETWRPLLNECHRLINFYKSTINDTDDNFIEMKSNNGNDPKWDSYINMEIAKWH